MVAIRRMFAVAALAVAVAAVHLPLRPRTMCLLRATTGIPCPFCGGTTAMVDLGHGAVRNAVVASPLAVLLAGGLPWQGVLERQHWWQHWWRRRRVRMAVVAAVLLAAECWQLVRFHLVGG